MITVTLFTKDDEYTVYLDMTADAAREMLSGTGRRVLVDGSGDELKMLHIARIEDWNWEVREWDEGETFGVRGDESDVGFGLCRPAPPPQDTILIGGVYVRMVNEGSYDVTCYGAGGSGEDTNFRSGATEDTRMESPDLPDASKYEEEGNLVDAYRNVLLSVPSNDPGEIEQDVEVFSRQPPVVQRLVIERARQLVALANARDAESTEPPDPAFQGDTTQAFDAIKRFI